MYLSEITTCKREVRVPGVLDGTQVWKIDTQTLSTELPVDIWVVESNPGVQFFRRLIIGMERTYWARELLRCMIWSIKNQLREAEGTFAQWVPLSGGLYFRAFNAMREISPRFKLLPLRTTFVEAGRAEEPSGSGRWRAKVWNSRKGYWFAPNIIIAEGAMASGSTGEAMVEFIVEKAEEMGEDLPRCIWLFVAAGCRQGIVRTYQACQRHGIELKVILSQALFEVTEEAGPSSGKTWTDLCLLHPQTVISRGYLGIAQGEWQGMQGCAVGDVGEAFVRTARYARNTCRELFARLRMDPQGISEDHCSFDLARLLKDCPFLLQLEGGDDKEEVRAVEAALMKQVS